MRTVHLELSRERNPSKDFSVVFARSPVSVISFLTGLPPLQAALGR